jgi:hypothetical protein
MAERSLGFDLQQMKALEALGLSATAVADLQTSVTNLNAWLNADAGVTDVNYDITPQA